MSFLETFAVLAVAVAACAPLGGCSDESPRAAPTTAVGDGGAAGTAAGGAADATAPQDADGALVLYCGRSKPQVESVVEAFTAATGREVEVRYADTTELASLLLDEGAASPCDVYWAQDAGALGALSQAGRLAALPPGVLELVPAQFASRRGDWVGVSGRVRVVAYSTERVRADELPASILGFTDPRWKERIGWPPRNASFQAFVTALRQTAGDDAARAWLTGVQANAPRTYPKNSAALAAIAAGEIDVAFVNHYYLHQARAERGPDLPVANHHFPGADVGNLVNVAGAGVMASSQRPTGARLLVEHLLAPASQEHFARVTFEYPLRLGVAPPGDLPALDSVRAPDVDLNRLEDLVATVRLLRELRILQ